MAVSVKIMTIPGAPLEGTNPLPKFHNKNEANIKTAPDYPEALRIDIGSRAPVLPYKVQDRYSRKRVNMAMKSIIMENDYLKATFWPENGGRLYSLIDKVTGRELLMANPVYQPGNLALRNAWLSGGIEWNFGAVGHHYFTCDHLFAAILKDNDGNDFVRMYEYERCKGNVYQMDFHLPENSNLLYAHVKLFNPTDADSTTYWWTNIAIPEDGHTRVLSSTDMAIVMAGGNGWTYEQLPYISPFPGKDLSYPLNASRSFDYFFQAPEGSRTAWEAGAYSDGLVFFERATAPLLYRKMFCWGNHSAGNHWQEFLSDPGKGYYVEIQGGFARTQHHDKLFPAASTLEWTQCFGGAMLDKDQLHQPDYAAANRYFDEHINGVISEDELWQRHEIFCQLAQIPVQEQDLIHQGSGWGALEAMRMEKQGEKPFPASVCFPASTIGPEQYPWYALLHDGILPEASPNEIPASWMVAPKWMELLEQSLKNGGENWYSLLHYGVMLNETMDRSHIAYEASRWGKYPQYRAAARQALEQSVALQPSVWALRCVFCIAVEEGDNQLAQQYYDRVFTMDGAFVDFAFAAEYMIWLNKLGKYEKVWDLYTRLPGQMQKVERIVICTAQAAIKLRKLDFIGEEVFSRSEFADIREGENSLTDIWFEYSALKLAQQKGITDPDPDMLDQLIDEAWVSCPPPAAIDFRMSFDRAKKYRVEQ